MAVPLLEPNYIGTMRQLEAQARENEKNRAAQANENNKQFGFDIGKALLAGGLGMGANALDKHLDLPLKLAELGGYESDGNPVPETPAPAVDDAVRGAALSVLADKVKSPAEPPPVAAPVPTAPPRPWTLKPPSAIKPEMPDAQNPTFAGGLPTETTPVTKDWSALAPPAPKPAPEPDSKPTVTGQSFTDEARALATERVKAPTPQVEPLSGTNAALKQVAALKRRSMNAASLRDEAYAASLSAKPGNDPLADEKLRKLKLESAKLEADAKNAAAAYEAGTPQYEARRTKAWDDAFAAVSKTEARTSGSTSLLGGSGATNRPRAIGAVVDDGSGWPRTLFPDAQGRFLYHSADGSTTDYQVTYDKRLQAYRAVSAVQATPDARGRLIKTRISVKPSPAPSGPRGVQVSLAAAGGGATPPTAAPAASLPLDARIRALGLEPTATPQQIRDRGSDTQLALLPQNERIERRNEANALSLEAQRLVDEAKAKVTKAGGASNIAAAQAAYQGAVSKLQSIGAEESGTVSKRLGATDQLFPLTNGRYREGGASLNESTLAEAKQGHPYAPVGDEEVDAQRRPLYEKVRQTYAAARQAAGQDFSRQKVAAAKSAMLGYFRAHPTAEGVSLSKILGEWGVDLSDSEKREVLRALQPDQPALAPGPSEPSPGQPPPPSDVKIEPPVQSKADDLFTRINAQPWSAAKKRRVFLATAQRDGFA